MAMVLSLYKHITNTNNVISHKQLILSDVCFFYVCIQFLYYRETALYIGRVVRSKRKKKIHIMRMKWNVLSVCYWRVFCDFLFILIRNKYKRCVKYIYIMNEWTGIAMSFGMELRHKCDRSIRLVYYGTWYKQAVRCWDLVVSNK